MQWRRRSRPGGAWQARVREVQKRRPSTRAARLEGSGRPVGEHALDFVEVAADDGREEVRTRNFRMPLEKPAGGFRVHPALGTTDSPVETGHPEERGDALFVRAHVDASARQLRAARHEKADRARLVVKGRPCEWRQVRGLRVTRRVGAERPVQRCGIALQDRGMRSGRSFVNRIEDVDASLSRIRSQHARLPL